MYKKEFEVGHIAYAVTYDKNEFILYVDCLKSRRQTAEFTSDPLSWFGEDDGPVEKVAHISPLVRTKQPLLVYTQVLSFINDVVGKTAPYYFIYSANEQKKFRIYENIADRLAQKHGYHLEADNGTFRFYKTQCERSMEIGSLPRL